MIVLVNANSKLSDLTDDQMSVVMCWLHDSNEETLEKLSDLTDDQMSVVMYWLHDSNEEALEKCARNLTMTVLDGDV